MTRQVVRVVRARRVGQCEGCLRDAEQDRWGRRGAKLLLPGHAFTAGDFCGSCLRSPEVIRRALLHIAMDLIGAIDRSEQWLRDSPTATKAQRERERKADKQDVRNIAALLSAAESGDIRLPKPWPLPPIDRLATRVRAKLKPYVRAGAGVA